MLQVVVYSREKLILLFLHPMDRLQISLNPSQNELSDDYANDDDAHAWMHLIKRRKQNDDFLDSLWNLEANV